MPNAITHTQE